MNKKVTSILSYCTIIGWLIAYLAGDKENARFHLNQGLTLGIVGLAFEIVFGITGAVLGAIANIGGIVGGLFSLLGSIVGIIAWIVGILVAVLIVFGILNAVNDKEEPLPVIGKFTFLK